MIAIKKESDMAKKLSYDFHFTIIASVLLGSLFIVTFYSYRYDNSQLKDTLIAQDLKTLIHIFKEIDKTCTILGFIHQKNYIDFLNIKSFEGSQVGSMNLAYPEKWQGPYLKETLTMQECPYMIVKNKKGLFIVPGEGVKLANGKIIGKDILFDYRSDIEKLMYDPHGLLYKDTPLAKHLVLKGQDNKVLEEMMKVDED
jgi:hypothetical protein